MKKAGLSEEMALKLIMNVSDLVYVCDTEGNISYVNAAFEKLSGRRPGEFMGRSFAPLFEDEDLERATEVYRRTLEGESPVYELAFRDTGIICEYKNFPVRDDTGRVVGVMGIARDVTEKIRFETDLSKRDRILEAIAYASERFLAPGPPEVVMDDVLAKLGEAAGVSRVCVFENYVNAQDEPAAAQVHEWTADGIPPLAEATDLADFTWDERGLGRWAKIMGRGEPVYGRAEEFPEAEREVLNSQNVFTVAAMPVFVEGRWWGFLGFSQSFAPRRWSDHEISALASAAGLIGAALGRGLLEKALTEKSRQLSEAQRISRIGSWEWDTLRDVITWSDEFCRIFDLSPEDLREDAHEKFLSRIHPEDRDRVGDTLKEALRDGRPFEAEYRSMRPDGVVRHIHGRGRAVTDESGRVVKLTGVSQDVTEKRLFENRIEESERRFRDIFEGVNDGILMLDMEDNTLVLGNDRMCRMLGYGPEEIRGLHVSQVIPEDTGMSLAERMAHIERVKSGAITLDTGVPLRRKDGTVFYADISNSLINFSGRKCLLGAFRDVTEKREYQKKLDTYRGNLEAIFRSVSDAIVTVSTDMTIIELNEAAREICGLERDAVGRRFDELICNRECLGALGEVFRDKAPVRDLRFECRSGGGGRARSIALNIHPLLDSDDRFTGAVLVMRDETRLTHLERDLNERKRLHNIVARSRGMQEVFNLIEDLADIDTTVLVTGESGTGKELVAEALHHTGVRRSGPLVKVNCSALSEQLLESELFGHVKGSFTGAVRDRVGRFQLADGGTIFLDEIGDVSPQVQLKLLRVLQTREFERLGDSETTSVDIRIIAATNQDLAERVRTGEFREDLYYRLKVVEIELPPLKDRGEDIPLLVEHFIGRFNQKYGRNVTGLSPEVSELFMAHSWPGNVRELEHALEHAFILCRRGTIEARHLPKDLRDGPGAGGIRLRRYYRPPAGDERKRLAEALEETGGNKTRAAEMLGMSRRTLYRKLKEYGMEGGGD